MNRLVTNDKSQVQVIARAATILRALEEENSGLSLGQIAQRVNLARSTVQRIVAALETEKLVIAATPNGRVRLGPTILRLAASVRSDFVAMARPFLERLSEELHETVDLSTVKKDHLVFIDQVIGSQRLRAVSAVGDTFPLYCTANGKAYLAQLTDKAIEALIGRATRRERRRHSRGSTHCLPISGRRGATASPMTAKNTHWASAPWALRCTIRSATRSPSPCRCRANALQAGRRLLPSGWSPPKKPWRLT